METPREQIEIGQRLNAARLRRGFSQQTVARRAGIAPSYLSRIENGRIQPSFPMVLRVLRALRADFEEVIGPSPTGRTPVCPVSAAGRCLLDLIRPEPETHGAGEEESYSPREIRLLRRVAAWMRTARPDRVRALELLLEDLVRAP